MRFSTILFPLAVLASFVLASPVEERATKVSAVASAGEPKGEAGTASVRPGTAVHAEGSGATAAKPGKSKRSDYNELDDRATPYATLYVCTGYGCSGTCYWYNLPVAPWVCHWVPWYNSVYVAASDGLTYGVFVGTNCYGVLVPYVDTCYNIYPTGNTWFIN